MWNLYDALKTLREYKSMNKKDFAEKIGVPRSSYCDIENGNRCPNVEFIRDIATAFPDVRTDWLLTGDGEMLKSEPAASTITCVVDGDILYRAIKMSEELLDENHRVMDADNKAKLVIATYELLRADRIEAKPLLQLIRAAA